VKVSKEEYGRLSGMSQQGWKKCKGAFVPEAANVLMGGRVMVEENWPPASHLLAARELSTSREFSLRVFGGRSPKWGGIEALGDMKERRRAESRPASEGGGGRRKNCLRNLHESSGWRSNRGGRKRFKKRGGRKREMRRGGYRGVYSKQHSIG